jgi:hypothetical protein
MGSHSTHPGTAMVLRLIVLVIATGGVVSRPATAQEKKAANPASVFDEEKDTATKKDAGATTKDAPATKAPAVAEHETIGFTQQNAASQMNELEERMFRLSEALRGLEPENASRLSLALRFSREELILEQMRETYKLLNDQQLNRAETEAKELIAKLEHLRNLLLAEDLDFQLKLARLRQMRETLGQLDRIVKEQQRELGWSRFALEQRRRLERFATRRPDLEALVRDHQAVIADTKTLKDEKDASKVKETRAAIRERESKVRGAGAALANDPLFADLQPPHLRRADTHLSEAITSLEGTDADAAVAAGEKALDLLRQELSRFREQVSQTEKTIAESAFRRRQDDQAKNRDNTEKLGVMSARLGDAGIILRKDLIRASASMQSAAQKLSKYTAGPAAEDQSAAVEVLTSSRNELAQSVERLLEELRKELRGRLVRDLMEMHENQMFIRETIQAQAPRVAQKSRAALLAVTGLSKKQTEHAERIEHLLALVEETDFGIALPTTLHIFGREMHSLGGWLDAGDVAPRTIAMETRIEEDLLKLMGVLRRLPTESPPAPGTPFPTNGKERGRELNRLVAELTMVRMLQARLNDDTVGVDKIRPGAANLPPTVRRDIETLEATQDEVRESLAKMAERLPFPDENDPE